MSVSYPLRRISISKWNKYVLIAQHDRLRQFLPKTDPYSPHALAGYLTRHGQAVIKSELGGGGNQVCLVSKRSRGYEWQDCRRTVRVRRLRDLSASLPLWTVREKCVVQQYIDLCPMKGRPTDIRIIIQRNEGGVFEITGIFCKTAPPARFVTNVKQGGAISSLSRYLRACCKAKDTRRLVRSRLLQAAQGIGDCYGPQFRNSVYGIDLGLDHAYRVYIIEVNTKPSLEILSQISGRMHQRALFLQAWNRAATRPLTQTARTIPDNSSPHASDNGSPHAPDNSSPHASDTGSPHAPDTAILLGSPEIDDPLAILRDDGNRMDPAALLPDGFNAQVFMLWTTPPSVGLRYP
ncbi:MAG: YheC/YheD family protein [Bacilli bacterium]